MRNKQELFIHTLFVALFVCCIANIEAFASDKAQLTNVDLVPGCAFRVNLPKQSKLVVDEKRRTSAGLFVANPKNFKISKHIFPLNLSFACYDAGEDVVQKSWAKLSSKGDRWELNIGQEELSQLKGNFYFKSFNTGSMKGWAITIDDVNGEEDFRVRQLYYCLVGLQDAVCGGGVMGGLVEIKRDSTSDLTVNALAILRSIEFLEEGVPLQVGMLPAFDEKEGDFGMGCRLKLDVPSMASFRHSREESDLRGVPRLGTGWGNIKLTGLPYPYKETLSISFDCNGRSDARYHLARWVSLACKNKQWMLTNEGRDSLAKGMAHLYEVKTKNAVGVAIVADDIAQNDINNRSRNLYFCLCHSPTTVCGQTDVGYALTIRRSPQADLAPYVLAILRSVEFLENSEKPASCSDE